MSAVLVIVSVMARSSGCCCFAGIQMHKTYSRDEPHSFCYNSICQILQNWVKQTNKNKQDKECRSTRSYCLTLQTVSYQVSAYAFSRTSFGKPTVFHSSAPSSRMIASKLSYTVRKPTALLFANPCRVSG